MEKVLQEIKSDHDLRGCLLVLVGVAVSLAPYLVVAQGVLIPASTIRNIEFIGSGLMGSGLGMVWGHIVFSLWKSVEIIRAHMRGLPEPSKEISSKPNEEAAPKN